MGLARELVVHEDADKNWGDGRTLIIMSFPTWEYAKMWFVFWISFNFNIYYLALHFGILVCLSFSLPFISIRKDCTPDMKQPDWLGGVDIIVVPLRTSLDGCQTFHISDISVYDLDGFNASYIQNVADQLKSAGANTVVGTDRFV